MSGRQESRYACGCGWSGWESELAGGEIVAEGDRDTWIATWLCPKCGLREDATNGPCFTGEGWNEGAA